MGSASLATSIHPPTRSWDRTAWPRDVGRRWALRLICGLPLVAMALGAARAGVTSEELDILATNAEAVRRGGLEELSLAYPPIPTLLTAVLPGGAVGISVASALSGGWALQLILARLVRRRVRPMVAAAMIGSLVLSPVVWFQATLNPSQFMALMFLVVAVDGFIRFVVREDTAGGFAAGLALAGAFLCDPAGLVYAAALTVAVPLLSPNPGFNPRNRAAVLVLAFPTLSMLVSWAFLEWRFSGSAFATVWQRGDALQVTAETLTKSVIEVASTVTMAAVFVAVVIIVVRRRPRAAATLVAAPVAMATATVLGLSLAPGLGMVLLTVVALYSVPRRHTAVEGAGLAVAAVLQVVLTLATGFDADQVEPFLDALI